MERAWTGCLLAAGVDSRIVVAVAAAAGGTFGYCHHRRTVHGQNYLKWVL